MFSKMLFPILGFILLSNCIFASDITGVYREESSNLGIQIEESELADGYIVYRVFLDSSGAVRQNFEWQSAFIPAGSFPSVLFYWKTGRIEETMPESNKLIVYNLSIQSNKLVGSYYFPEEPRTSPATIQFVKIKR